MNVIISYPPGCGSALRSVYEYTWKSIDESQHFDPSSIPFLDLSSDELLEELWEEGVNRCFRPPSYWPKKRGNYVRSYVLSNLRIQAKLTRLKVEWNLEALWDTLPVELIISIFEFLHPIDLYHAIRATKGLRRFLLDKNSTTIWKESFLNHPDIPFYPPDVSAPQWASLIFGPATCDNCGTDNALVDYAFRLRKCNDCMDDAYSDDQVVLDTIHPIIGEFQDQLDDIWNLALRIYRYDSFYYATEEEHNHDEPRYSIKDLTDRAHEMRKYLLDIRSSAPDAHANYQTFLSVTGAAIQERMKQAKRCEIWAQHIYKCSERAFVASVPAFCVKSEKALRKQEHDPRDVRQAEAVFESTMLQLTRANWADLSDPVLSVSKLWKYLPQLESMVEKNRVTRIGIELANRIKRRRGTIEACYFETITACLTPEKASCMPHPEKLYSQKFCMDYIHDPKESVDELDVISAKSHILRFIDAYMTAEKRRLLKTLVNKGLLPKEATEDSNPDDFLGLAIAVFECCLDLDCVFVGWEDVGIHRPSPGSCAEAVVNQGDYVFPVALFEFSDIGYQVLRNLAEPLHLDLRFLLAKDLDKLNKRFICKACKFHRQAGLHGLHSMTWRECLTHAKQMLGVQSKILHGTAFDVITEALTTSILATEQPFPPPGDSNWICKCCNSFQPLKRAEVITHVRTAHDTTKPVEGVDFIYCRTEGNPKRNPLFVGLDKHSNHRCMRCPLPKSLRLWKKTPDMFRHILDKHAIQLEDFVEGVDWIKVEAVEDDTWIEEKIHAEGILLA